MRTVAVACVLAMCASIGAAFRFNAPRPSVKMRRTMYENNKPTELVPLDKVNIENAATVTTGIFGLIIAGPIGAILFAAIGKYTSKKENEAGDALRGVGKTVVEVYNFVTKLNDKYKISDKAIDTVTKATSSIEDDTFKTMKENTNSAVSKIQAFSTEYDILTKAKQALEVAGTLSDTALEKVEELNAKVFSTPT
jgi:hypothetical protein